MSTESIDIKSSFSCVKEKQGTRPHLNILVSRGGLEPPQACTH